MPETVKPKISIIVPCYNAEDYIDRCVESIIRQSMELNSIQILLVNDASTDDTLKYLERWENRYPESICVITYDQNIRQGGARNVGLHYATGDYICFADSDDWLEPDALETLYSTAIQGDYDVVQGRYEYNYQYALCKNITTEYAIKQFHFSSNNGISIWDAKPMEKTGIWTGLYRRKLIEEHQIFFPEGCIFEDNYWWAVLRLYVKSYCYIEYVVYHYYHNPTSTMHKIDAMHHYDRLKVETMLLEYYKKVGAFDILYPSICNNFVQSYYLNLLYMVFTRHTKVPNIYESLRQVILSNFPDYKKYIDYSDKSEPEILLLDLLDKYERFNELQWLEVRKSYLEILRLIQSP